jgi:HEAT repeat protein
MKKWFAVVLAFSCLVSLVQAQVKEDVPALVKQLKDPDETLRLKAAKSLGKLGADAKDAIPALTEALFYELKVSSACPLA